MVELFDYIWSCLDLELFLVGQFHPSQIIQQELEIKKAFQGEEQFEFGLSRKFSIFLMLTHEIVSRH